MPEKVSEASFNDDDVTSHRSTVDVASNASKSTSAIAKVRETFRRRRSERSDPPEMASTSSFNDADVATVESHFIETFLTLMLKLSLDDFKPIFYRIFNSVQAGNFFLKPTLSLDLKKSIEFKVLIFIRKLQQNRNLC